VRNLDSQETYLSDMSGLALELRDLVGSGPNPDQAYLPPYGVVGFGEGWWAARLARRWLNHELTPQGTQFVLEGGYDLGEALGAGLYAEAGGAQIVRLGLHENDEVIVAASALSPYRYLRFLLLATGQPDELARVDQALLAEREHLRPEVFTDRNPAKFLAYNLLERVPLWVVSERYGGLAAALQQTLARIGKILSITPPPSGLEFFVTALEGSFPGDGEVAKHQQGNELAAVVIGDDERTRLAVEILEPRVDTVIELPKPPVEGLLAESLVYWYRVAWASYYLALLKGIDPGDREDLANLREAT
jgi:hypothetical protein